MTNTTRIEYEATDIAVHAAEHLGMLVMAVATSKDEKIAVHMRRSVFDHLCDEIDAVRMNEGKPVPRR